MPDILLKSSDGKLFSVDVKVAKQSVTIKTMLEDLGFTKEEEDQPVPLPNVTGEILEKIIEWATFHKDDPPYVDDEHNEKKIDDICDWDRQFMTVTKKVLFDIILAANYLDIKPLLDLGCKTVASMIKGKTPEELRKTFNTKDTRDNVVSNEIFAAAVAASSATMLKETDENNKIDA